MPLFGKSSKSPAEVVKNLKDSLTNLEKFGGDTVGGKKVEKAQDDVSKYLFSISSLLFNNCDTDQQSDIILAQLSQEMYSSQLIPALLRNLSNMEFEARKETAEIFKHVLKRQIGTRTPTVEYIGTCDEILSTLCKGYEDQNICHNTGNMLRECLIYESLAKIVLLSENFKDFFKYVQLAQFDIAADAFSTFKDLLSRHKTIASHFLSSHFDDFFQKYNLLIQSDNFVTKLSALKLLNDLLHDRHNLSVMKKYVNSEDNLKLIMNMLLENKTTIQLTAFSVFRIFLENPKKTDEVDRILFDNKDLLIEFFECSTNINCDNDRFLADKSSVVDQLKAMEH